MNRKLISLCVMCLLLTQLFISGPVLAGVADQINIMKELFKIPGGARLERQSYGETVVVTWSLTQGGKEAWGYANLRADTGELVYYEENYESTRLPVEMSRPDIQKYIENIISRMLPDKKSKVRLMETPVRYSYENNTYYTFLFQRYEGDIPVRGNYLSFEFNASTGRLTSFAPVWYEGSFPSRAPKISILDAGRILTGEVPLQLEWLKIPGSGGDLKFNLRPVYKAVEGYAVDALTAEMLKIGFTASVIPYEFNLTNAAKRYPIISPVNTISESEALAAARNKAGVGSRLKLDESYTFWNWGEQGRTRDFVFVADNFEEESHVVVDSVTGQVTGIFNYSYSQGQPSNEPRYSYESEKTKAENQCRLLIPEEFSEMKLVEQIADSADFLYPEYSYVRYIYGIPYKENGADISFDTFTGKLQSFNFRWERNLDIPTISGILNEKQARAVLAEKAEMELVYWIEANYDDKTLDYIENARLVYVPKETVLAPYDAITGSMVEIGRIPKGTAGHWAEADFRFLAEKGIINADSSISPDKPISRAEFTKMLVLASYLPPKEVKTATFSDVGLSNPLIGYIEQAYTRGIVKGSGGKFLPDRPIARQEVAVILIKALKSEGRIGPEIETQETGFKDRSLIASWASQDVKLAAQLGYIKGSNGYFKPVNSITWAEAAALISNYISEEGH